jgi:hypothetical protein
MADIVTELAEKCGISTEQAQKGLGVVLGLLKNVLPAESFANISGAVPDADRMMATAAETGEQESGGLASTVKGVLGKLLGSGGSEALVAKFGELGLSADQIHAFFAKVMEFLKGKLPENVTNQISGLLPTPQEAAH